MINKITLIDRGVRQNIPYSYILSGRPNAEVLVVMISGMLYDLANPPSDSIYLKVRQRISNIALSLEVEQIDNRYRTTDGLRELTIADQSRRIEKSLIEVLDTHPLLNKVIYVAHSMGSVVLYNMLQNQPKLIKKLDSSCFLLAPVPYGVKIGNKAKEVTESLLSKDIDNSTAAKSIFIGHDNTKIEFDENIWQNLDKITDDYNNNLSPFSQFEKKDELRFILATDDNIFENDADLLKKRFPESRVKTFKSTHSFKDDLASSKIVDEISNKIIELSR